MSVFNLPDLGEGLTEAEIVEWLVEDGDEVVVDQTVVVVETAKATVDVPCPYAGRVATRHGAVGDVVPVGSPLITVGDSAEAATVLSGARQYREEERAGATVPAESNGATADEGSGAVLIGYGTGATPSTRRRRVVRPAATRTNSPAKADDPRHAAPAPSRERQGVVRVISPIVRKLAQDNGIDLLSLPAARAGDVVRRADVEAAVGGMTERAAATGDERIPLTGIRRTVADRVTTSRREIPDATTWVDVDATGLVEAKAALGLERIAVLAIMARICVAGLVKFPELNASVDVEAQEIVRHGAVHLGIAAQSPRGLVVPVVRDAQNLTTRELASRLRELVDQAKAGTIAPQDLTGSTFTLNNYGVFGVDGSTPIINHPEAGMLGVGRIIDRPWVVDGELAVRKVTQLGLSFDHRVCDGGVAGGFLRFVADAVERPVVLLADL
ncbi:dihydrolipoamide acetyltransferase family protein [Luteipulveratus mongoliensis]|uniref:Dihydrolipoamide acetyltransferase component of pyruvate dehydrogenase complex n=1 Tax=Luteipulveratus mongoliensis TaxID=571913 RepID=A0A0K1JFK0_9MICO|nr:dihydrolipoamide acetyltransferase family protein [Luteipulveratus mongoliensis]AKU15358.1 branched-chain alpha-keto acid dehydrogenase subunit E2 [Luteipulveratus mongoliensis]